MTNADLEACREATVERYSRTKEVVDDLDPAPSIAESSDRTADALAEGIFLREFSAYESILERLFLHYVTGGFSLDGRKANTYLSTSDLNIARDITRGGSKFLSWSNPERIRGTAKLYIENGWPICDTMYGASYDLRDCERIRHRIAHKSDESLSAFNDVQRNLLGTERVFPLTPGQLLRMRRRRLKKLHIGYYIEVMNRAVSMIIEPPP